MTPLTDTDAARLLGLSSKQLPDWTQGLVITDSSLAHNPIVYASRGFTALTGYAVEEIVGRNCRFLQGANSDRAVIAEIRAAVARRERCDRDLLNYRRDGTPFWNHLSVGPLETPESDTLMVGLQFDVSFRHHRAL